MGTVNIWENLTADEVARYQQESEQQPDEDASTWAARAAKLHDAWETEAFSRSEGGTHAPEGGTA